MDAVVRARWKGGVSWRIGATGDGIANQQGLDQAFGDAVFRGSMGGKVLNAPVQSLSFGSIQLVAGSVSASISLMLGTMPRATRSKGPLTECSARTCDIACSARTTRSGSAITVPSGRGPAAAGPRT